MLHLLSQPPNSHLTVSVSIEYLAKPFHGCIEGLVVISNESFDTLVHDLILVANDILEGRIYRSMQRYVSCVYLMVEVHLY